MAEDDIGVAVREAIESAGRYPFLFIGSGLSRRYLNAPDWEGLLRKVCELAFDGDEYAFPGYMGRAKTAVDRGEASSLYPYVATIMEDDVDKELLSGDRFSGFRLRHRDALLDKASPMRVLVSEIVGSYGFVDCPETESLRAAGLEKVSGIITTNYDSLCETLFPEFECYVGEEDLLFRDPSFAQEIYKIHGSANDPSSMVLTEADYMRFSKKEKYLAAKLLTIFAEYPVIFLGYSLQDENVRSILASVAECVGLDRVDLLAGRMIFVQRSKTGASSVGTHSMVFGSQQVSMTRVEVDDFSVVYDAISSSRKFYSVKFVKEMRGGIYRLAEKIDPSSEIISSGVDAVLDGMPPDSKVAITISTHPETMGKPVKAADLYEDVVLDNRMLNPKLVVESYLEDLIKHNSGGLPIFKYLSCFDGQLYGRVLEEAEKRQDYESYLNRTQKRDRDKKRDEFKEKSILSVEGIIREYGTDGAFKYLYVLDEGEIDVDALGKYLKGVLLKNPSILETSSGSESSEYRRAVRIYDYLRYKPLYDKRMPPDLLQ